MEDGFVVFINYMDPIMNGFLEPQQFVDERNEIFWKAHVHPQYYSLLKKCIRTPQSEKQLESNKPKKWGPETARFW